MLGEFGIVYKGYLAKQYTDEIVAIKTLKGKIINFTRINQYL